MIYRRLCQVLDARRETQRHSCGGLRFRRDLLPFCLLLEPSKVGAVQGQPTLTQLNRLRLPNATHDLRSHWLGRLADSMRRCLWVKRPTWSLMPSSKSIQFRCVLHAATIQAVCVALLLSSGRTQQNPAEKEPVQGQQSGMSTGVAHAPVKDALSRPITAGGFVDGAPVIFIDVTHAAGIDKFHHRSGAPEKRTILETPGSGVALLDYDNDGWLDIFLLNGSTFPALKGKEAPPRAMLLHNNHDLTFTDVTEKAGVANERWGFGVAIGDFDNDGWPDIYVSNFGKNRLYHNNHDGTFTDVAEKAGVALGAWST